jgi:hypothetical protein
MEEGIRIGKELGTSVADRDLGLWGSFKLDLGWMRCDGIPAAKRTFNLHQHMQNPQHSRSSSSMTSTHGMEFIGFL